MTLRQWSHAVFTATSLLLASLASAATTDTQLMSTPTAQPTNIRALSYIGCFATTVPMVNHGPYIYQTSGNCQQICLLFGNAAMGLGNGTDCWCGDAYPQQDAKVDDSQCSTPCAGYGTDKCGSGSALSVYNSGLSLNAAPFWNPSASSTSSAATLVVTEKATNSASSGGHSGSTVGIVVGVIVGVVVLGGLAGAGFFFLRRKQQRELEEYRQQQEVKSFVGGASSTADSTRPQMWAPDNRLNSDGSRRMSNGSIADNEDFSRRILQVRNPDGSGF